MIDLPSPNHGPRPLDLPIDLLIIHYTGMPTAAAAIERLRDPAAQVSAHYLIDEDGTVCQLVDESRRAWHAGVAYWRGHRDINSRSIGIELVNPGHEWGYRPFPDAQMAALEMLARSIVGRHGIAPSGVLGHSDVAPARKRDPGELFDWARLARAGVGAWADPSDEDDSAAAGNNEVIELLGRFGYDLAAAPVPDPAAVMLVTAFQRHFRPARVDGVADPETVRLLRALVRRYGR